MSSPTVKIEVSGARGESFADVARRTGAYGVLPGDSDAQALAKLNAAAEAAASSAALSAAAAMASAHMYPNTAAGLAATADQGYFSVPGTGDVFATLYQEVSGVAVAKATYPSSAGAWNRSNHTGSQAISTVTGLQAALDAKLASPAESLSFANPYGLAASSTLNNRYQRVFDAKAAGAPNNGTDDDAPTLQALYALAKAAGGGCILLPDGPIRMNTPLVIDDKRVSIVGAGAGATRWFNASKTANFITLKGADVHSIEIGHIQFEPLDGTAQTNGAVFSFERNGGSSSGAGCFDVKLHNFTTFNAFHGISTGFSAQGGSTPFLDVMVHQVMMRDMKAMGVHLTQMAGFKMDQYTIGFADPQGTQPGAGSGGIYLGDWVDGAWIGRGNILGGETGFDTGSDWSSAGRKPAQVEVAGLSSDSCWLSCVRLRDAYSMEFHRLIVGDLAGGGDAGLLINGSGSSFTQQDGVEYIRFIGGKVANCYGNGLTMQGKNRFVRFSNFDFLSNGRLSTTGAYNNAYVGPNQTDFGFENCLFDVDTAWWGANKAGYALNIDTGCDRYRLRDNTFNAAKHYTGGLFNNSSGAATKIIDGGFV